MATEVEREGIPEMVNLDLSEFGMVYVGGDTEGCGVFPKNNNIVILAGNTFYVTYDVGGLKKVMVGPYSYTQRRKDDIQELKEMYGL